MNEQNSSKTGLIIGIVIVIAVLIGGFLLLNNGSGNDSKTITQSELSAADGKNGNDCYVAIDGKVYQIEGSDKWVDGVHTESNQAKCGEDLSDVIGESDHGRSILSDESVNEIGTLE